MRLFRRLALSSGLLGMTLGACAAHADTVASLLGNFTINQYCGVTIEHAAVAVHYAVVFGQLPALRELHAADADGDGVTSQQERDAYVATLADGLANGMTLVVDGVALPLHALHTTSSLPTEQGGFSLRLDVDLAATMPGPTGAPRSVSFDNHNYAGRIGWHEVVVATAPGITGFDTDAFDDSLTGGLTEALKSLPATGPLDERRVHLRITDGMPPASAVLLGPRPGTTAAPMARTSTAPGNDDPSRAAPPTAGSSAAGSPAAAGPAAAAPGALPTDSTESRWIARETHRLVDAISGPHLEPRVAFLALLGAMLLGAVHALSPGHGKTIVGAYLIGSRGTPRHAVFLGATVTITHTLGVFVLGFATLYASRFIVPERLFPILSLVSAVLVLGMGIVLLVQRGRAARQVLAGGAEAPLMFQPVGTVAADASFPNRFVLAPAHSLALADPTMHSHGGGPLHSHLPPGAAGEKVTWRSLLTLGISGGLVPCPSAMVLLLAAVALNKTAYGMLLVVAFSVGLAITLTVVGLAFLYARNRFGGSDRQTRWQLLLPVLSALTITLLGVALSYAALRSFSA